MRLHRFGERPHAADVHLQQAAEDRVEQIGRRYRALLARADEIGHHWSRENQRPLAPEQVDLDRLPAHRLGPAGLVDSHREGHAVVSQVMSIDAWPSGPKSLTTRWPAD